MVTRQQKRDAVEIMRDKGLPLRKSCDLVGIHKNTASYIFRRKPDAELTEQIRTIALKHNRFGYRRITAEIRKTGFIVNHKRVFRIYRCTNLVIRRKRHKRKLDVKPVKLPIPMQANDCWSCDFMSDAFETGRRYRTLNVLDDFSRGCLAIEVDTSLPGQRVVRLFSSLVATYGKPKSIRTDNGPEFRSKAVQKWAETNGITMAFIEKGKPTQNALVESFNGKLRDECLNQTRFCCVLEAKKELETWRNFYNNERPHSSLKYMTPAAYAAKHSYQLQEVATQQNVKLSA